MFDPKEDKDTSFHDNILSSHIHTECTLSHPSDHCMNAGCQLALHQFNQKVVDLEYEKKEVLGECRRISHEGHDDTVRISQLRAKTSILQASLDDATLHIAQLSRIPMSPSATLQFNNWILSEKEKNASEQARNQVEVTEQNEKVLRTLQDTIQVQEDERRTESTTAHVRETHLLEQVHQLEEAVRTIHEELQHVQTKNALPPPSKEIPGLCTTCTKHEHEMKSWENLVVDKEMEMVQSLQKDALSKVSLIFHFHTRQHVVHAFWMWKTYNQSCSQQVLLRQLATRERAIQLSWRRKTSIAKICNKMLLNTVSYVYISKVYFLTTIFHPRDPSFVENSIVGNMEKCLKTLCFNVIFTNCTKKCTILNDKWRNTNDILSNTFS